MPPRSERVRDVGQCARVGPNLPLPPPRFLVVFSTRPCGTEGSHAARRCCTTTDVHVNRVQASWCNSSSRERGAMTSCNLEKLCTALRRVWFFRVSVSVIWKKVLGVQRGGGPDLLRVPHRRFLRVSREHGAPATTQEVHTRGLPNRRREQVTPTHTMKKLCVKCKGTPTTPGYRGEPSWDTFAWVLLSVSGRSQLHRNLSTTLLTQPPCLLALCP